MKVQNDWWKDFFDGTYLLTDARSVCNRTLTRKEVTFLEGVLCLDTKDRILDLCGGHGRHSLELARRGYRDLTVLDFSRFLIKMGKKMAGEAGHSIKFICKDARDSGLRSEDYTVAFIMANSFGYFVEEKQNIRVLREVKRVLRRGGRLLLDLTDPEYVRKHLTPMSWHEANNDILVCRRRVLKGNIIKAQEVVVSKRKGMIRDGYYCERMYDKEKITRMLKTTGFKGISVKKNVCLHGKKKEYGFLTSRMIITATKV